MLELKQANDQLIYLKDTDFCEDSHIALMSILEDYELLNFEMRIYPCEMEDEDDYKYFTGTIMKEFNKILDTFMYGLSESSCLWEVKLLLKRK